MRNNMQKLLLLTRKRVHGLASQVISIKEYSITSITKYQYNSQRCKYIWMGSLAGPMNRCGLSNYSEYGSESALGSLEAVPIGAGTHLDGKFFVWLRQKLLKSVRIPASFFLARQKIFLANLHTVTYWYSFLIWGIIGHSY